MMNVKLLLEYGAIQTFFEKDDFIFEEGMQPEYFYYIVNGEVKLNTYYEDDKEFIFNFYKKGQNFGEGMIFLKKNYICNAIAVEPSEILLLNKSSFLFLIKENFDYALQINYNLSKKLYYQGLMAPKISAQAAEKRIMTLLEYLKKNGLQGIEEEQPFIVDLTRQEIGDMTGLRVETVIRTIRKLKEENKLRIEKGKIVL
ncbi:Crp/Fnr family transcriptional regulator [Myroides sp. N17-2]|uniref:Crp/Fnr family transcriptional regulator n=1 Tax=Myroides sp. N17-2 TaxID=2030799 RepID=UPI0020B112E8|nr:Crp/Fnr family transcriptional regulator [Myroides sp. N17-2]